MFEGMDKAEFESMKDETLLHLKGKRLADIDVIELGMGYGYRFTFDDGTLMDVTPEYDEGTYLTVKADTTTDTTAPTPKPIR